MAKFRLSTKAGFLILSVLTFGSLALGYAQPADAGHRRGPIIDDQSFSIQENQSGPIGTLFVTRKKRRQTFAIESDPSGGLFTLDPKTGLLSAGAAFDFEGTSAYVLTVSVTDGRGRSDTAAVTVEVTDVNEPPQLSGAGFVVAENGPAGSPAGAVSVSDPDQGAPYNEISFAIIDGNQQGLFALDTASGVITTTAPIDHESTSSVTLSVSATDGGGLSDTVPVTIQIADLNEAPQVADAAFAVDERLPAGTLVGVLQASDPDVSPPNGDLSFALAGAGAPFVIDAAGGEVRTTAALDATQADRYALVVEVTDGGGLTGTAQVAVAVNDINEAPRLDDAVFAVAENLPAGTLVGTLSAVDPDPTAPNNSVTYAFIAGNEGGQFTIAPGTGRIETAASLDFELSPSFALTVLAEDGGGLTDTASITVNVLDGPEPTLPQPPAVVSDLDGTNGSLLAGTLAGDRMGRSLGALGDVNGDGFLDYSVGSPNAHVAGDPDIGRFFVIFGAPDPLPGYLALEDSLFDGRFGAIVSGANTPGLAPSRFLNGGIGLGDVNGDDIADFMVNDGGFGGVYLFYGRRGPWQNINVVQFSPTRNPDASIASRFHRGGHGIPISLGRDVGDFDGDGLSDPGFYFIGRDNSNAGRTGEKIAVLYGRDGGFAAATRQDRIFGNLGPLDGLWIDGNDIVSDPIRRSDPIQNAGDVNGDGYDDALIPAAWGDPNGLLNAGHVYLVFGEPGRMTGEVLLPGLDGSNGVVLNGDESWAHFGGTASGLGDVNGDGFGDVVVGAPEADAISPRGGRAYVIFGRPEYLASEVNVSDLDGSNGFVVDPVGAVNVLGTTVNQAGDVNGDGYDDVLVVSPWAHDPVSGGFGQAYVIYGGPQGSFPAAIGATEVDRTRGFVFTGRTDISHAFGQDAAGVGDVNGDGFDDLIVADSGADTQGLASAGESYLIYGGNFSGAVTHLGDDGDDVLTGSDNADVMVGGRGNDLLIAGLGRDVLKGAAGDDVLAAGSLDFRRIDGGLGQDTLRLDGAGLRLDLQNTSRYRIAGIETLDLTGSGDNSVILDDLAVFNLSEETNEIRILGDAGDSAVIGTGWTFEGSMAQGNTNFAVYSLGNARLLVQDAVDVQ